jgi:hypothetical protein
MAPSVRGFTNINTQTTTTAKAGPGYLRRVVINKPLASGVITIYDNTAGSGTLVGVITMPATLLSDGPHSVPYDAYCATGITLVTTGADQDITVVWE